MIIDKSTHSYLLECMYDKTTHMKYYGQYPVGIRFHLGIIDNHDEMKKAYESDREYYVDDLIGCQKMISTENLKKIRTEGAYVYINNESFELENCTPTIMKSLKNDHWEYLRTNTYWGERGLKALGARIHTYFPEENHSKVLFWNFVYQEFVLINRIKTERPTSTINQDDDILAINIPYEGINREVLIVTSTKDKYRNHTETLKDAKIFVEPEENQLKVLYK